MNLKTGFSIWVRLISSSARQICTSAFVHFSFKYWPTGIICYIPQDKFSHRIHTCQCVSCVSDMTIFVFWINPVICAPNCNWCHVAELRLVTHCYHQIFRETFTENQSLHLPKCLDLFVILQLVMLQIVFTDWQQRELLGRKKGHREHEWVK